MNELKILEIFFEESSRKYHTRELSRILKVSPATISKYLAQLVKKDLLIFRKERNHNIYTTSNSKSFKVKKINYFIEKIIASGLIEHLEENLVPSCIILFGSFRKGESEKESDIDLFIETHKKNAPDLKKFEKKLGHKIELFLEPKINNLPEHLFNNVINGIKLQGSLKIK